jgi:plastocyanin
MPSSFLGKTASIGTGSLFEMVKDQPLTHELEKGEFIMTRGRQLLVGTGVAFILVMTGLLCSPVMTQAVNCRFITIHDMNTMDPISGVVHVKRGDCVFWIDMSHERRFKVTFPHGKECLLGIESKVGFDMEDASGCLVTGWMNYQGTASVTFTKPGTYAFEIEFEGGGTQKGSVIVK